MIPAALAGKRLFITGTTGFLGTNLLERLLRSVPDCELVLLVRPGKRSSIEQRVAREILKNDAFDRLRGELGKDGFAEMTARRITAVAGDVGRDGLGLDEAGRALLAGCDVVIHSAATVSFDSPLDSAVEVNLLGPSRIAAVLNEMGVAPHLVAVSTCYVAGNRRGSAPEQLVDESPFFVDVDWRKEVEGARRARSDAEAQSRTPEKLAEFRARARRELGAAGSPLLSDKTEQLRSRWVGDRMVEAGRARAASLGWPDAYAYTKALGELALNENRGDVPVSIVRPSIIETALAEPRPGWIRGFRMADPVIISYARGLLKEFPGVPEGIVDVIPVDLVSAAIIAVAAKGPEPDIEVVQVASGSQNPLHYRRLVDLVSDWFLEHPLYDPKGQPIVVAKWSFPGRGRVQGQLQRAQKTLERAESVLAQLPLRGKQAEWSASLESKREEAEQALGYVELYGAYAECEAVYGLDRLLALWDDQTDDDRRDFCFDPRVIEWDSFTTDIFLPSVVQQARVRTTPGGRTGPSRSERLRAQVLAPERQLAAFDLENTLIASNVVASYAYLATRRMPRDERLRFAASLLAEGPSLLSLDRADRSDFLRFFYRRYDGAPVQQIDEDAAEMFSRLIIAKSFPAAIRRVREHRAAGHRTVLITGALDFVVKPLTPLFDDIVAAEMGVRHGAYDGELTDVPPTGESRAQVLMDYAAAHGLDLSETVAYADSTSDLPMLEAAGFPVAVNPETRLAALARKRGWLVEHFAKAPGAPRRLVPIGPRRTRHGGLANPLVPGGTA
ncbi:HAD-IB family hydrolase [Rhabdothermincola salaria]|uniref:HAD-IB family hydrolase n=1 Tax=Rhabdothermincola salaria TaxID=2903142 RepID=UPI001E413986|nr:HAD-IB family hydrolase [Rhabdothermincola salaria]